MRRLTPLWLLPALALGAPTAIAVTGPAPAAALGDLAALQVEYDAALAAWRPKFDAAQGRERAERGQADPVGSCGQSRQELTLFPKELRKLLANRSPQAGEHPTRSFWERYEALGRSGEGRAYQWLLDNAKDLGLKRDERGRTVQVIYTALLEDHAEEPWFDEVVSRVARDARYLGDDEVGRWLATAGKTARSPMASALATVKYAELLAGSDDEATAERGKLMLAEYERGNLLVGATALDFRAKTLEGHAFKLSDYRGKAVLIDFYGFW